ncbi:uncharacterized protein CG7065-like [Chironomus tepperi]|uniref:uncharacterized protein CG7065-like n=1 Tax=Chironomus tepperi TaxID=113505 RepID=UPI00391F7726
MSEASEKSSSKVNVDAKIDEIRREYRFYKKYGEKHPLYNTTWKIFWERRYTEIKKEGKHDPDQYDYKFDWVNYWMNYIKEYYYNKIDFYKKKDIKRLHLSPISISSSEDSMSNKSYKKENKKQSRKSSRYSDSSSEDSSYSKTPKKSLRSIKSLTHIESDAFVDINPISSNETVSLISVCRTLAVLDSDLGSLLSNKIIDLIGKSIQLEKVQANSSDEFLMTSDNVTFLETVKEKLKGLVYTNLLEPKKIPVAKTCIQNIAKLVHQNRQTPTEKKENCQIVKDPELTEIIAKALASFGKNDALPEELEVIKEIYLEELEKNIEMAKKDNVECHPSLNLSKSSISNYKDLDDDELFTLFKNFPKMDEDEQNNFISFITEIEETDPERVRRLQDFITNGQQPSATIVINDDDDDDYNFDELVATIK